MWFYQELRDNIIDQLLHFRFKNDRDIVPEVPIAGKGTVCFIFRARCWSTSDPIFMMYNNGVAICIGTRSVVFHLASVPFIYRHGSDISVLLLPSSHKCFSDDQPFQVLGSSVSDHSMSNGYLPRLTSVLQSMRA